ncbi:MAG TPA: peptidoglycan DD-metalloendopeptidase family protein [Bradyrhizobium sp.]|nr:peptidoglycan DD-metalloendopeptidase family protein [Bradyrhizobium sp.]
MSFVAELLCSRRVPHAAVLALVSFAFAGCSADTSTRFSQTVTNPFNYQPESTGSVAAAAPAPQVERHELPQYARPQPYASSASGAPPVVAAPQSYPSAAAGVSGGGRGMASYTPPAPVNTYAPPVQPRLEATGSVPPRSVAAAPRPAHVKIIVGTSDTLEVLARRYHVTPAAILAANGYKGPRTLSPGQSLLIPQPAASAAATEAPAAAPVAAVAPAPAAAAVKPVAIATAPASAATVHVVNHGDTLHSIAHRYHVTVAELMRANNLDADAKLKLGARLNVPAKVAAAAPAAPAAALQPVAAAPAAAPKLASAASPQQSARLAQAAPTAEDGAPESTVKAAEATGALPTFRWPVRGKVIASYGAKTNGKSNDGINLAVPEGTPVKAAEDGVVAYAGNELKGYGNLVLVRHSNGYVTAYAHASELLVKRGDTIKRGQVIAKSGQSGEVASPQLHFEIRKGSQPVDPLQFLNGA